MNPTIMKIIDLMFRGVPENEETSAIREELITNSQARYEDLIASGLSPDDALGQVLDNLRGMEEVLDEYRSGKTARAAGQGSGDDGSFAFARFEKMAEEIDRRMENIGDRVEDTAETALDSAKNALDNAMESVRSAMDRLGSSFRGGMDRNTDSSEYPVNSLWQEKNTWGDDDDSVLTAVFQPGQVRRISMHLVGEDIEAEPSPDGCVHVEINKQDEPMLQLELNDGCLSLKRLPHRRTDEQQDMEYEELDGISGIFAGIGRALRGVLRIDRTSGDPVRLLVPRGIELLTLQTTSGDMDLTDLILGGLTAATTSGDVELENCTVTGAAHAASTSGDVDVSDCVFSDSLSLAATSGDIDFSGDAARLSVNNVSGDTDLQGRLLQVKANSVSGDIDIRTETPFESVQANTTSGDIEVAMPADAVACVQTNTVCGSVDVGCASDPASDAVIRLNTVSGDITVANS